MPPRRRHALTDAAIRNLSPGARPYGKPDGGGLFVHVTRKGSKSWRYAYRFGGKRKTLTFGLYPDVSLKRARELHAEARENLAAGLDPCALKQERKRGEELAKLNTFAAAARAWLAEKLPRWSPGHAKDQARRLEKDVLPEVGKFPLAKVKAPDLVRALKAIAAKGPETAKRARVIIQSVCRFAVNLGLIDADPSTTLKDALDPPSPKHYPAPTDPAEVGAILRALDAPGVSGPVVRAALRFHPLVAVRPGELEKARWADFDLTAKEWRFTASKTHTPHVVPLSKQALAILEEVRPYSGGSEFVFPNGRTLKRPMSNGAMRMALAAAGVTPDVLVPHGWRAVFRTLGAEQCGFSWDCMEAALAHSVPDALGRAYNRTQWLEQRRDMMQQWADYLDELKENPGVKTK